MNLNLKKDISPFRWPTVPINGSLQFYLPLMIRGMSIGFYEKEYDMRRCELGCTLYTLDYVIFHKGLGCRVRVSGFKGRVWQGLGLRG